MTGIVDYNAGNIKSVERALAYLKAPYVLSKNPKDLENVDRIIFPGVGEAAYAMQQLKETGFDSFLKDWVKSKKKLLGICLGAQIIFDESEESNTKCLGLVPGVIRHFETLWKERGPNEDECRESALLHNALKVPHMGWNDVTFCNGGTKLVEGVADKTDFYFVHSYVIQVPDATVVKALFLPASSTRKNLENRDLPFCAIMFCPTWHQIQREVPNAKKKNHHLP